MSGFQKLFSKWFVKRLKKPSVVTHCALGWSLRPQSGYSDGTIIFSKKADLFVNRRFYKHDPDNLDAWPIDPETGEKLPTEAELKEMRRNRRKPIAHTTEG